MAYIVKQDDSGYINDSVEYRHWKSPVTKSNFKDPTPFGHSRLTMTVGHNLQEHWAYKWKDGTYKTVHRVSVDNNYSTGAPPEAWSNAYFNHYNGHFVRQTNVYHEAITKALADLNQHKWKVGTLLAEVMGTASYLSKVTIDLCNYIKVIRNPSYFFRNKGRARYTMRKLGITHKQLRPRKLADRWLETQFAILPLVDDLQKGVETVATKLDGIDLAYVTVTRSVQRPIEEESSRHVDGVNSSWKFYTSSIKGSYRATARYHARVTDPSIVALKGFQLDTPSVAWQAVPFSWLVDTVIPMSTFFSALSGPKGLSFVNGYVSENFSGTINLSQEEWRPDLTNQTDNGMSYHKLSTQQLNFTAYDRNLLYSFPNIKPYIRFDQGPWNFVTVLALLTSTSAGSSVAKH